VGRNYRAHAAELGHDVPAEPLIFFKPPSSLLADGAPIVLPAASGRVEHEGEVAVVIGRRLRHAEDAAAREAISHVLPLNDVTARDLQRSDGQWTRAKGFDTFCPVGTPVAVADLPGRLEDLSVRTRVNGEPRQHGRVAEMIVPVASVVAWISRIMTLEVGDIVSTGTPAGVGPLAPGDRVEVEIPGVGSVANPVVAATAPGAADPAS
jgi:2-keto-4-pentenoate hydratase/2-oxohepta-3-ene-1,7-dioic acid hydratase in catechol pathway